MHQHDDDDDDKDDTDSVIDVFQSYEFSITWIILSICVYLLDFGWDIYLVVNYFLQTNYWFGGITLFCLIIPSAVSAILSYIWLKRDLKLSGDACLSDDHPKQWKCHSLGYVFFAPLMYYIDVLVLASQMERCKREMKKYSYKKKAQELYVADEDGALIRIIECALESCPQFVLQLYNILGESGTIEQKLLSKLTLPISLGSLTWAVVAYQRALRRTKTDRNNISWRGTFVLFLTHVFINASRLVSITLVTVCYSWVTAVVCGAHWLVMWVWLYFTAVCGRCDDESANKSRFRSGVPESFFDAVMAAIYIFVFVNVKDEPTFFKYVAYYTVFSVENLIMCLVWLFECQSGCIAWGSGYVMLISLAFFTGVALHVTYYKYCHPNKSNRANTRAVQT